MHCRAVLLLDQELYELQSNPIWGISIHRLPQFPLICFAKISGLKDTLWEQGTFHATLRFSEHFNEEPPEVIFNTIPFHPNVHEITGKLFYKLNDTTSENSETRKVKLRDVLLTIQKLLSHPVLKDAVNYKAREMFEANSLQYDEVVEQCVRESQSIYEILDTNLLESFSPLHSAKVKPVLETIQPKTDSKIPSTVNSLKTKQVSFDVYHRSWVQVATSKPVSKYEEPLAEDEDRITLRMWNPDYSTTRSYSPASIKMDYKRIKSPNVKSSETSTQQNFLQKKKQDRIATLKNLYLNKDILPDYDQLSTAPSSDVTKKMNRPERAPPSEPWDAGADELLEWTKSLNADKM